jgi:hypothetical protein
MLQQFGRQWVDAVTMKAGKFRCAAAAVLLLMLMLMLLMLLRHLTP